MVYISGGVGCYIRRFFRRCSLAGEGLQYLPFLGCTSAADVTLLKYLVSENRHALKKYENLGGLPFATLDKRNMNIRHSGATARKKTRRKCRYIAKTMEES